MLEYFKVWRSRLFVGTLRNPNAIIMQAYRKAVNITNACQVYSAECVPKIRLILSIILYPIYEDVRFQFTNLEYDDFERACTVPYYHHPIGIIINWPLFRVR